MRAVKFEYKLEETYRSSIGAVFMIDMSFSNILSKIDRKNVYDYIVYSDEMTFMIDDIIEMESYWYDIELIFKFYGEYSFFRGKVISGSIKKNGCIAVIKNTSMVKKDLKVLMKMGRNDMKKAYIELKNKMLNSFEDIWEFLNKLKIFYLKTIQFNRSILLFC